MLSFSTLKFRLGSYSLNCEAGLRPPTVQPSFWSPCRNAVARSCPSVSFSGYSISTPIRLSVCCARATSGQTTAAEPATPLMKSRRLIAFPQRLGTKHRIASHEQSERGECDDSQCPLWVISGHFRSAIGMSALPPKADIDSQAKENWPAGLPLPSAGRALAPGTRTQAQRRTRLLVFVRARADAVVRGLCIHDLV